MKYKVGDVVKLKSKEKLIELGTWYRQCADECGGKSYKIDDIDKNVYWSDGVAFDEESIACLVSEAELSEKKVTYTFDELKKRVDEFREYLLNFEKRNICMINVDFTTSQVIMEAYNKYDIKTNIKIFLFGYRKEYKGNSSIKIADLVMELIRSNKTKLKWKEPKKYKDDYKYPIVQVQESNGSIFFKFTPYKKATFKALYITIENYKQYSALDIVNALENIGFNTRHSYDAVINFYHERDLDLGFTKKILKPIK